MGCALPNKESAMAPKLLAHCVLRAATAAVLLGAAALLGPGPSSGQGVKGAGNGKQPDFIPADYDDYQNMLTQLGIQKMRKGRDAKVKDSSDEATANPYRETLPD